jgi:hypothetical protein
MKRSGIADLPLHGGHVPQWLAQRMTGARRGNYRSDRFGLRHVGISVATERPVLVSGAGSRDGDGLAFLWRHDVSNGALKRGLALRANELGLYICGGRGKFSRNTPNELREIAYRCGFDADALVRTSRLTARVDNNAIADGFQIYLHSFVVASNGEWAVVQQGLNDRTGMARRYHWHSAAVRDFVAEPHTGIVGKHQGTVMNLVDAHAKPAQRAMLQIAQESPERMLGEVRRLRMPAHHDVRAQDVDLKRLGAVLAVAYDRGLHDFAELLLLEKLGPRTLQSLALVAEVIHGAPTRFDDPARFSFAHGGKDGHPFPVPLKTLRQIHSLSSQCARPGEVRRNPQQQ